MDQPPTSFVLASGSWIRQKLLRDAGFAFVSQAPMLDEAACLEPDPDARAAILAREKALEVAADHPDALVLGSDQVFSFEGISRAKPETDAELRDQLRLINGKTHQFHCGLALVWGQTVIYEEVCHANVELYELTDDQLEDYAKTREGLGCAGGYRLEERGIHILKGIEGSHFTVLGLPMYELVAALRRLGWADTFLCPATEETA